MKPVEIIQTSKKELKKILLKKLCDKIFHITSQIGYEGIIKEQKILPSNKKKIKHKIWNYNKYCAIRNCVSVVDLYHNKDLKLILNALDNYNFCDPYSVVNSNIAYFLILKKELYDSKKIITWKEIKKEREKTKKFGEQTVPNLEACIKEYIKLSEIDYIIKVETEKELTKKELSELYLSYLPKSI